MQRSWTSLRTASATSQPSLLVLSMLLTVPAFAFSTGFTDVSEKATYAESVSYLADAGILRGTASGRFAPNEKITVSQWATI